MATHAGCAAATAGKSSLSGTSTSRPKRASPVDAGSSLWNKSMNNQYQFALSVRCPNGKIHVQAFDVDAFAAKQFEPYDLCSDPLTAMMAGGVLPSGSARINADRERLAKQISTALTEGILKAIKSRDLHNGYEQK